MNNRRLVTTTTTIVAILTAAGLVAVPFTVRAAAPQDASAAASLTPAEQARFATGRSLYKSLCIACHQADGQGADVAGNLVTSPIVIGRPDVALRVLLNGKEGDFGLMPALGVGLDDEQIAGVLTYLRREWGHTASPVDPATVKEVRALTGSRTTPWTDAELKTLLASTSAR